MMRLGLIIAVLLLASQAQAQNVFQTPAGPGQSTTGIVMMCLNKAGLAVPCQPGASSRNFPGCTVGTSSGSCLAANTANQFLQIQNPGTNAVNVACAFGGAAVLGGAGSVTLVPGQGASWGLVTGGIPSGQMNCVAGGAATPFYVEWN